MKWNVSGVEEATLGLYEGNFTQMGPRSVSNIINLGGIILRSARSKEFRTEEDRHKKLSNNARKTVLTL